MALSTTDLSPRIGTQIHTDLETLVSGRHAAEIRQLAEQRGVLLFRGIEMNDEQQLAFTRTLGPVQGDKSGDVYKVSFDPVESPEFYFYTPGNFSWHIDRTDSDVPPFCTILNSKRLALEGGETEFANTYAAWEDLPEADKALVETCSPPEPGNAEGMALERAPVPPPGLEPPFGPQVADPRLVGHIYRGHGR
jgi:alpha-ketoglutarate-dependent taurine dioxygenase